MATKKKAAKPSSRELLLDAAEALMTESGYAAVTSRRVAARAGLKPQLIHYYFRSMDDLFVALYRRYANRMIENQEAIRDSATPLRDLWRVTTEARGVLLSEFIALANHRKVIQQEITEFGHRFRQNQIRMLARLLEKDDTGAFPWSPEFASMLLNSVARSVAVEGEFGITEGHAEALELLEQFIDRFDG